MTEGWPSVFLEVPLRHGVSIPPLWMIHAQHAAILEDGARFNAVWRPKGQGDRLANSGPGG
jgi:hypothetical protein